MITKFRAWFENNESQKDEQLRDIWNDAFKALVGGADRETVLGWSLKQATEGDSQRKPARLTIMARLNDAQVFDRLRKLDPKFAQSSQETMNWLGQEDNEGVSPKRLSDLFQRLFGDSFQKMIGDKVVASEPPKAKAQLPAQPPKQNGTPEPDSAEMGPDMMGGVPAGPQQVGQNPQQPLPQTPQQQPAMPPRPPGANQGMF